MPTLPNPKHERFAQELAKGKSQTEAYSEAGYKPSIAHASRLAANGSIQARLAELLGNAADRSEISIAFLTESLLRIADKAEKLKEAAGLNVAKGALMDAAKVNGFVVERKEVGRPGEFESMNADQLREYIDRQTAELSQGISAATVTNGSGKPH